MYWIFDNQAGRINRQISGIKKVYLNKPDQQHSLILYIELGAIWNLPGSFLTIEVVNIAV